MARQDTSYSAFENVWRDSSGSSTQRPRFAQRQLHVPSAAASGIPGGAPGGAPELGRLSSLTSMNEKDLLELKRCTGIKLFVNKERRMNSIWEDEEGLGYEKKAGWMDEGDKQTSL